MSPHTNRINAIDVAKGIGILCIVLGHIVPNSYVVRWLYAFHVPLFFLLSGFTYSLKEDKKAFYLNKVKRLLLPYLIFAVISIAIYVYVYSAIVRGGSASEETRIWPHLLGMLYANSNTGYMIWNRPLWFLPCLFATLAILDVFESWLRKRPANAHLPIRVGFILAAWAIGIIINTCVSDLYLPLHLETAIFLVGFSEMGLLLSQLEKEKNIISWIKRLGSIKTLGLVVLLLILGVLLSQINGKTDARGHMFGKWPPLLVITSILLSTAVLLLSNLLENNRCMLLLGGSSLSILLMHKFPILFFQEVVPVIKDLLATEDTFWGTLCGVLLAGVVLLLCILVEKVVVMMCPAIVGKTGKPKSLRS